MLNPNNEPGRLTLYGRFGHDKVEAHLPKLIRAVKKAGKYTVKVTMSGAATATKVFTIK